MTYDGWTPIRLAVDVSGGVVDWCFTAGASFEDPFFDQSVQRCLSAPGRMLFRRRTGLDRLREVAAESPRRPDGLVLHMSRCGSTLVSAMLTARGDTLALSEPPVIDTVVRAAAAGAATTSDVRAMFTVLGRLAAGRGYVVKCDAWTALDASVLDDALPTTPWVFVHRDPVEVLVSQLNRRGYHMIPGTLSAATLGIEDGVLARLSPVEHCAAVLGRIVSAAAAAVQHAGPRALLVDHADLPEAIDGIAEHFRLPAAVAEPARMREAATADAKNPHMLYADDRRRKQEAATAEVRAAAERWVSPAYQALLSSGRRAA